MTRYDGLLLAQSTTDRTDAHPLVAKPVPSLSVAQNTRYCLPTVRLAARPDYLRASCLSVSKPSLLVPIPCQLSLAARGP